MYEISMVVNDVNIKSPITLIFILSNIIFLIKIIDYFSFITLQYRFN